MLFPFLVQAAVSPTRQRSFRLVLTIHLGLLLGALWLLPHTESQRVPFLGPILILAGIVEGAVLVGWRLSQLPKSRALEFLLASPLRSSGVFLGEAATAAGRLALVTLSGLPVLALFSGLGHLGAGDVVVLIAMPFTWGTLTGLAFIVWAYEPPGVRRFGEAIALLMIVLYLAVGVLAGEHLKEWLSAVSPHLTDATLDVLGMAGRYNPFALSYAWLDDGAAWVGRPMLVWVEGAALIVCLLMLARAACRFKAHFRELHYQPLIDRRGQGRGGVTDRPLTWWAVRRVAKFSGRINLWLACGVGSTYALFIVAGDAWPGWLGRNTFEVFDRLGGIPAWTTVLILLSAVPAAFQYGLWDSNAHDRCRKLELFLLTDLDGNDYWHASLRAAFRRGLGYFIVAIMLLLAGWAAGRLNPQRVFATAAAGVILWTGYFALGYLAFARGQEAARWGARITIGLPILAFVLDKAGLFGLVNLLPPGSVFHACTADPDLFWCAACIALGLAGILIGLSARSSCLQGLQLWYERHHGRKMMD
jgi:hypothetical protein